MILPTSTVNPVTIGFSASNVPLGSTIQLTVTPTTGTITTVTSAGLTGTEADSTDNVQVDLPQGESVLSASVSFAITTADASQYLPFTNGEMVASVTVTSEMGSGSSSIKLTTESGKIIQIPYSAING